MSQAKLLEETERSVGDPKLLDNHTKLKALRAQQADLEKELESKTRLQATEKQIYDSLKDSVGHIQEQNAIKKKLKTLKQKKNWVYFQTKRDEFNKVKDLCPIGIRFINKDIHLFIFKNINKVNLVGKRRTR